MSDEPQDQIEGSSEENTNEEKGNEQEEQKTEDNSENKQQTDETDSAQETLQDLENLEEETTCSEKVLSRKKRQLMDMPPRGCVGFDGSEEEEY